jgi:hypothetical protein
MHGSMMRRGWTIAFVGLLIALLGCSQQSRRGELDAVAEDAELSLLTEWMTGTFSSEAQAAADTSYFDIRLEMARIWPTRSDAVWLYVEQAVADHRDSPYRQRVYRLSRESGHNFASAIYLIPEPSRFVGAWRNPGTFDGLAPDSLSEREGCAVTIWRQDETTFVGKTDDHCPSELYGAAYATSEVRIEFDKMMSWDRGFDADGEQVWGAIEGGYVFTKLFPTGDIELR